MFEHKNWDNSAVHEHASLVLIHRAGKQSIWLQDDNDGIIMQLAVTQPDWFKVAEILSPEIFKFIC